MIRTGFSFRHSAGHLEEVMSRIKEIGLIKAPVCDRNSTFAFNKWSKLSKKEGIDPVFGVEIGVTESMGDKRPTLDYWKFFAKDSIRPLNDLVALATSNPGAGKEPSISYAQAREAEGLFKISGERVLLDHVDRSDPDFFIGLSPALPLGTIMRAKREGWQVAAISDNVYTREQDREFYRIMLGSRANTQSYPQHILSDVEWSAAIIWPQAADLKGEAIKNRDHILRRCRASLKKATLVVPEKPKTLRQMCLDGAERLGCDLSRPGYAERMDRELSVIAEKQFEDYFYILADVIGFAKTRMIVGPARGSSCGSLVCYLLGITTIDPIPFGLIFERFIDITRADLPDVDVDFSDERRHEVFAYMEEKYGRDRIARLGSVGQFKPRSALHQVGISLRIPSWDIEKVAEGAIKRAFGDSRASATIEDTLKDTEAGRKMLEQYPESIIVTRMENHPNSIGQHAAGMVITEDPIAEYVAVDSRTGSAMCDKKDAEDLNLLKIDALGLTQLSIFERTLDLVGVKEDYNTFLNKIPLDDPAAFEVLNRGNFSGIFQFIGSAVQGITKEIIVDGIEDLIAITALARPGPLASGGTDEWIKRRNGAKVEYPHPIFKPYLEDSLGIVIYQETVLKIGREIGDLTWADVTALRKAMSKSLGKEEFDRYGDPWKRAAIAKGIPKDICEKFWNDMCQFGAWAFNRAHSVAYGLVSYWCCWLKAHHPLEFAAATLDVQKDPGRQIQMLRELAKEGVDYIPFDPERSADRWVPMKVGNNRKLIGPLTNVDGIGPAAVIKILAARRKGIQLEGALAKKMEGSKTKIDSLWPIRDAVERIIPDLKAINIVSKPTAVIDLQAGADGSFLALVRVDRIAPSDVNAPVKVAKRGGRVLSGPNKTLNIFASDDTDEMLFWVDRFDFERIGRKVMEVGGAGKSLWAFKGRIPREFRMMRVEMARYLGRIDGPTFEERKAEELAKMETEEQKEEVMEKVAADEVSRKMAEERAGE